MTTRKVRKAVEHILHPITNFTASQSDNAVTILFAGKETFKTGGRITVLVGLTGASGGAPAGTTVFTISRGGRGILPS